MKRLIILFTLVVEATGCCLNAPLRAHFPVIITIPSGFHFPGEIPKEIEFSIQGEWETPFSLQLTNTPSIYQEDDPSLHYEILPPQQEQLNPSKSIRLKLKTLQLNNPKYNKNGIFSVKIKDASGAIAILPIEIYKEIQITEPSKLTNLQLKN